MATETARIVIEGIDNGATETLTKVAKGTDRVTTASQAAGAQLADLTRQVSATTKAQDENAKAQNRAKLAADEHTATVRAFGAASVQAAETQARLTRAIDAAKLAAASCDTEVDQLKLAFAKTNAEVDKSTPALAKAARAIDKVGETAERQAHELRKLELGMKSVGKSGGESFAGVSAGLGKLNNLLAAGGAVAAVSGLASSISAANERAFQLASAQAALTIQIDAARRSTGGLISNYNLMTAANQAVSLGVVKTDAEFAKLAEAATKLALKMGTDVPSAVGGLATALGRGSTELLDNYGVTLKVADANRLYAAQLGKTVDQLTEEEKKNSIRVIGMQKIMEAAEASGVALDSQAAKLAAQSAAWDNMTDAMAQAASTASGVVMQSFQGVGMALGDAAASYSLAESSMFSFDQYLRIVTTDIEKQTAALIAQADAGADAMIAAEKAAAAYQPTDLDRKLADRLAKEQAAFAEEQAYQDMFYGPEEAPKSAKGKSGKKVNAANPYDVAIARTGDGRDATDSIALAAGMDEVERAAMAEAAAVEQATAAREAAIESIALEIEARQAAGLAFDDLTAKRVAAERDLYEYTKRNSQDSARLAANETRHEKAQHAARLATIRATYAAEQKEQAARQARMQVMAGAVQGFGSAVVGAMEAEANGSKGAIAKSLQAWLVGVRNQMIVKSLVETALGVASAASYNYPGAAAHFTAAGLAGAAAVAAGTAGAVIGAAVPGDSGGAGGGAAGASGGGSSASSSSSLGGGGSSSGGRDGNERQDVPVSWTEQKRTADMPRQVAANGPTINYVTNVHPTGLFVGTEAKLGQEIVRLQEKGRRAGKL